MQDYFTLCMNALVSAFEWFSALNDKYMFMTYAVALFSFFCIWRFILSPILGGSSGSSDQARKSKKGGK